jgi:imidazolonepropionase-like amidohydrolase
MKFSDVFTERGNIHRACMAFAGVALLCCSTPTLAAPIVADLIFRHAIIVDVEHSTLIADQTVVIRDGTLVDVGADAGLATKWRAPISIDAKGRYLIPGLWDMHVHFGGGPELIEENKALLPLYIAHGITTVRDCSGDLSQEVLKWRGEIAQKQLLGPQLFTSGA